MGHMLFKRYTIVKPTLSDDGNDKALYKDLISVLDKTLKDRNCCDNVRLYFSMGDGYDSQISDCELFEETFVNGTKPKMISFFASGRRSGSDSLEITVLFERSRRSPSCTISFSAVGFTEAVLKDIADEIASCLSHSSSDIAEVKNRSRYYHTAEPVKRVEEESENRRVRFTLIEFFLELFQKVLSIFIHSV